VVAWLRHFYPVRQSDLGAVQPRFINEAVRGNNSEGHAVRNDLPILNTLHDNLRVKGWKKAAGHHRRETKEFGWH